MTLRAVRLRLASWHVAGATPAGWRRSVARWGAGLVALLLMAIALPGQARDNYLAEAGLLCDAGGRLGIAQARSAAYQAMPTVLAMGFVGDACWVRLRVRPPAGVDELVLRIRPAYLDDLQLYAPDAAAPGGWRVSQVGDHFSQALRERPGAVQNLMLHGLSGETTVFLRVRSSSNLQLHVEALTERDADDADNVQTAWFGIYLGVMLALLAWALVDYQASRDRVLAWFIPYQVTGMLYGAAVTGYLGWALPLHWSGHAGLLTSALVIAVPFFGILCNRALLQAHQPARWGLQLLGALLLLPVLEMLALLSGHAQPALAANAALVLLLGPLLFAISLTTRAQGAPPRWVLRLVYGLLALHLTAVVLPVLGLVEAAAWRLHIGLIQGLLTGMMIFALLQLRSRELLRSRQQALVALQVAQERAERERLEKEEKSRFMAMLTHELHSPMLVMRLAMAQMEGDAAGRTQALSRSNLHQALSDMEKLIDRCVQADRVEQIGQVAAREPLALSPLLHELVQATGQPERVALSPAPDVELRSDETLFRVVMGNLLDNALKYSPEGSTVQLRWHLQETGPAGPVRVLLRIANMPGRAGAPDPHRAFEKYYRSAGARVQRGTGLGLWLVRAISRHLGGDATLAIEGGQVVFQVELPGG
ncbi:MAG TPA: 7TM-DISM domain-containing protein [Ideonella sp.]|nr:7TM-DISM domain-containing protein [Ideonella sp.]